MAKKNNPFRVIVRAVPAGHLIPGHRIHLNQEWVPVTSVVPSVLQRGRLSIYTTEGLYSVSDKQTLVEVAR